MAFDLYTDEFESDMVGGKDRIMPGFYHFFVETVDEDGGKNGSMHVEFQVLRSTASGQETKIFAMDFSKDMGGSKSAKWAQAKLAAFATGTGLCTMKQIDDARANRQNMAIEWTEAVGRSCCMEIEADEDGQYKDMPKLRFANIWRPDDKRASRVPLHATTIQREGIKLPAGRHIDGALAPKTGGNAKAEKQPAKKSAAPEISTDDLLEGVI